MGCGNRTTTGFMQHCYVLTKIANTEVIKDYQTYFLADKKYFGYCMIQSDVFISNLLLNIGICDILQHIV